MPDKPETYGKNRDLKRMVKAHKLLNKLTLQALKRRERCQA